jgi:hypothetical protein
VSVLDTGADTDVDADTEPGDFDPGQRVRWKQGKRWRYGHLGDGVLARDGSLCVYDDTTGAARSLRVTDLERQVRGPRGGRRWEAYGDAAPASAPAPAAQAAPGDARVLVGR